METTVVRYEGDALIFGDVRTGDYRCHPDAILAMVNLLDAPYVGTNNVDMTVAWSDVRLYKGTVPLLLPYKGAREPSPRIPEFPEPSPCIYVVFSNKEGE